MAISPWWGKLAAFADCPPFTHGRQGPHSHLSRVPHLSCFILRASVCWQEELKEALKLRPELDGLLHLGLRSRSLEQCFTEMDLDGDGAIQYEEFKFFCDKSASSPAVVFASIDADGDGNLTLVCLCCDEIRTMRAADGPALRCTRGRRN